MVTLTVHTQPIIDGNEETIERKVHVNDSVTLPCPATALPPPTRIWSYEGQKLENLGLSINVSFALFVVNHFLLQYRIDSNGSLILPVVELDYTGTYTCLVSNLAGDDSINYSLDVFEKPKIISEVPGTIDAVKGHTVEIPCKATGIPDPDRTWEKDGIRVQ